MATGSSVHPDPPPPPEPMTVCPEPNCHGVLGDLRLCQGMGAVLQNYNRWYQVCTQCNRCQFYGELTRIEDIPEDIQLRHVLNMSTQQNKKANDSLFCTHPGCTVQKNGRPKNANKGCSNEPPLCSHCCAIANPNGNCKAHRRYTLSQVALHQGRAVSHAVPPHGDLLLLQPGSANVMALRPAPSHTSTPSTTPAVLQPAPLPLGAILSQSDSSLPGLQPSTTIVFAPQRAPSQPAPYCQHDGIEPGPVTLRSIISGQTPPPTASGTHPHTAIVATQSPQLLPTTSQPASLARGRPNARAVSYARPLTEDYGQGYVKMSQQKAEQAALIDGARAVQQQLANTMSVSLWVKGGEGPEKLDVTTKIPTTLVVSDHRCLLDLLGVSELSLIKVYNTTERAWRARQVNLPIPIPSTRYILLRSVDLTDDACPALNEEIAAALGLKKRPRLPSSVPSTPSKVRKFTSDSLPKTPQRNEEDDTSDELPLELPVAAPLAASLLRPDSPTIVLHSDRVISPIPFPYLWTCDMAERMAPIAHFNSHPEVHFSRAFPNSKYNKSTFYAHRSHYREAHRLGILHEHVAAGRGPGGEWHLLTKRMKDIKQGKAPVPSLASALTAITAGPSLSGTPVITDLQAPPLPVDMVEHIGRLEWFEGCSSADFSSRWTPQTDGISLTISGAVQQVGRLKDVYHMSVSEPNRYAGRYVAKRVRQSDVNWMDVPFYNEANVNFREAERVARAGDIAAMFVYAASEVSTVYHFQFVQTYVVHVRLESDDPVAGYPTTWIAQKRLIGDAFVAVGDSDTSPSLLSLSLDAFMHYALEKHELLLDSFEGIYIGQGLHFYSCKTHTRYGNKMHIEDRGPYAVNAFGYHHKCNMICRALKLSDIPIDPDFELAL